MNSLQGAVAVATFVSLSAPSVHAQSTCGTPGVTIAVTPPVAAPGEPFSLTMTNSFAQSLILGNTCLVDRVFPGTTCSGAPVFEAQLCGPVILGLDPGESIVFGWNQQDSFGQQVPNGTYSIEVGYFVNAPTTCCVVVTIADFTESCLGDGGDQLGCTDCPCGNNAAPGTIGGCVNASGSSCRLTASGSGSVSASDLSFDASGAVPLVFSRLFSADELAPANVANPCMGLNSGVTSVSFDGLRCAVQGVVRHGLRMADANGDVGVTNPGWDAASGLPGFGAFLPGDTRHFQLVYRDDFASGCMTGQNTSQAVTVSFTP